MTIIELWSFPFIYSEDLIDHGKEDFSYVNFRIIINLVVNVQRNPRNERHGNGMSLDPRRNKAAEPRSSTGCGSIASVWLRSSEKVCNSRGPKTSRASDKSSAHSEAERPSIRSEAWLVPFTYDNVYYQRRTPVVRGAPIVHKSDREIRGIETKHLDVLHDIAHAIIALRNSERSNFVITYNCPLCNSVNNI